MSWQHREYREDGSYWLAARGDDDARTITTYSEDGAVLSVRDYTDTENRQADQQQADRAQDAALLDHEARLARIEAHLWPPVDPDADVPATVPTMADYAGIWPAGQLLSDGGKVWRNVTTVPLTTAPSGFPGRPSQWTRLFERVTSDTQSDYPAWSPDATYTAGDRVTNVGRAWECLLGHGPERRGTWAPGVAHTVWTDLGPAPNGAAW